MRLRRRPLLRLNPKISNINLAVKPLVNIETRDLKMLSAVANKAGQTQYPALINSSIYTNGLKLAREIEKTV